MQCVHARQLDAGVALEGDCPQPQCPSREGDTLSNVSAAEQTEGQTRERSRSLGEGFAIPYFRALLLRCSGMGAASEAVPHWSPFTAQVLDQCHIKLV